MCFQLSQEHQDTGGKQNQIQLVHMLYQCRKIYENLMEQGDDGDEANEANLVKTLKRKICGRFGWKTSEGSGSKDPYATAAFHAQVVKVPDDVWAATDSFIQDCE